jgi:hypothetical protein
MKMKAIYDETLEGSKKKKTKKKLLELLNFRNINIWRE